MQSSNHESVIECEEGSLGNIESKSFGANPSKFQTAPNKRKNKVIIVDEEEEKEFGIHTSVNNHISLGSINAQVVMVNSNGLDQQSNLVMFGITQKQNLISPDRKKFSAVNFGDQVYEEADLLRIKSQMNWQNHYLVGGAIQEEENEKEFDILKKESYTQQQISATKLGRSKTPANGRGTQV